MYKTKRVATAVALLVLWQPLLAGPGTGPGENAPAASTPTYNYTAALSALQADARPVVDKITGKTAVDAKDWVFAAHFAPVFYQSVSTTPRGDYMLRFDYDGEWSGITKWHNIDKESADMRGHVY